MSNGKGSARRPAAISEQDQRSRWAQTFGVVTPSPQPNTNGDTVAIIKPPKPPDESP